MGLNSIRDCSSLRRIPIETYGGLTVSDPKAAASKMYDDAARKKVDELKKVNSNDKTNSAGEQSIENLIEVPTECIPVNISLPCTVYMQTHGKYLVFKRQGEKINYKQALEMQKKGTLALYIHKAVWNMLKESLKDLAIPESETNESEQILYTRHLLLAYGNELDKKQKEDQRPVLEKIRRQGEMVAEALIKSPTSAFQLLRTGGTAENFLTNHPLNVCIWSVLIGQKLAIAPADIKTLGSAAFLHDIGNTFVPKRILMKREKLNEEEEEVYQLHTRKGAEYLNDHGFPPILGTIIDQHQERPDGKGYPNRLSDRDIHQLSKIVAVADAFDELTSNRPIAPAITSKEAVVVMKKVEGQFDKKTLAALTEIINAI